MNSLKTITFIGSGNVATHLANALFHKGLTIKQIYSKTLSNATTLANQVDANSCTSLNDIETGADIYIVSIKDDEITNILPQLSIKNELIVHTSGGISIDVLQSFQNYGIFYPLQTFSKHQNIDISLVPFCIEANTQENIEQLVGLAKTLSENVQVVNSEQRKKIHLAAVFACNFSNYMYTIAEDILNDSKLDLNLLKPLIKETADKIEWTPAKEAQTGPAKRNDQEVIKNHLTMLAHSKDYQDIYKLITENIIKKS